MAKARLNVGAYQLTVHERLNLVYLSHGLTGKQIADRRGVRQDTVYRQLGWARDKLEARSNCHAVAIAYRRGLIG